MTTAVFLIAAVAALVSAIGVVVARNPVHSAINLVGTLFSVAVLFVLQEAPFLAAVQVLVYAGAIVVLFLFVIMLLGVDREEALQEPLRWQRPVAVLLGAGTLAAVATVAFGTLDTGARSARGPSVSAPEGNVEAIGTSLFTDFIWPFEITSVLLVIAVVGAVVLVRTERGSTSRTGRVEDEQP